MKRKPRRKPKYNDNDDLPPVEMPSTDDIVKDFDNFEKQFADVLGKNDTKCRDDDTFLSGGVNKFSDLKPSQGDQKPKNSDPKASSKPSEPILHDSNEDQPMLECPEKPMSMLEFPVLNPETEPDVPRKSLDLNFGEVTTEAPQAKTPP